MYLRFRCPGCQTPLGTDLGESSEKLLCGGCGWTRPLTPAEANQDAPPSCLVCGCRDLWRQKDFPQRLGVALVALGATLSTIAYAYYMPVLALGILLAFALGDLLLYTWMEDVLVCYRCGARYGRTNLSQETRYFNLEVAERYRQETLRLKKAQDSAVSGD